VKEADNDLASIDLSDISIVVTHYQAVAHLRVCLDSIETAAGPLRPEVIVCDSAADGKVEELLKDYPQVRYIGFDDNVGYAALVNAGMMQSRGEFILVLNADTAINATTIPKLLRAMRSEPRTGIVAPALVFPDGKVQQSAFADYRLLTPLFRRTSLGKSRRGKADLARFHLEHRGGTLTREPLHPDWVMGAALFVRREAAAIVGPMDTRYWMYFEDVDWCRRFRAADWIITWYPDAQVVHHWGRASRNAGLAQALRNPMGWRHLVSGFKYFAKYGVLK
jgi:N-acetylglucosaminyl-diphospho-decaprenol L-rhamnosyltransferase